MVWDWFNIFRASAQQHCDPPTNEQYWVPGREAQILGAIMSTWTAKQPDELGLVREKAAAFAEHAWNYRPWPYPESGPGSWAEFQPRSAAADTLLDAYIGSLIRNYNCDQQTLQCVPMQRFPNGTHFTNGSDWQSNCGSQHGKECCGKPCPGPAPGIVYGGRLFVTHGGPSTNMSFGGKTGIAAADALCASQAPTDSGLPAEYYKALLADEAGCGGKPCRRASVTPGWGDGAIDWVIAPNAAYYLLDNTTLVTVSNATRMLGVANHTKVGGGNQLAPFVKGWVTAPNSTCNSWRWTSGMPGGPYGVTLGSQGYPREPFTGGGSYRCSRSDFICVEMGSLGPWPPPPPPPPPPAPAPPPPAPPPPPHPTPTPGPHPPPTPPTPTPTPTPTPGPSPPKPAPPTPPAKPPVGYAFGGRLWVTQLNGVTGEWDLRCSGLLADDVGFVTL